MYIFPHRFYDELFPDNIKTSVTGLFDLSLRLTYLGVKIYRVYINKFIYKLYIDYIGLI